MNRNTRKELFLLFGAFTFAVILYKLIDFHYSFNRDTWYYAFGHYRIFQEQIKNGVLPLWNNYSALGSALMFKESLDLISSPVLFFLSVKDYLAITGLIYFLLSIYFMYKFLAGEGVRKSIALCAGIIWATNGFFLWHLHELIMQSVCLYIPLALLLVKKLSLRENIYRDWILFVIVNTLQLTYSRWDLYEYGLWAVFLYIIFAVKAGSRLKLSALVFFGVCCAFLLAAPVTVSYLKTIFSSQRQGGFTYPADYMNIRLIIQHLFPNTGAYDSRSYISLFVFPFALLALFKPKKIKLFPLSLIILYFLFAFKFKGIKPYEIIRLLPLHKANVNIFRTNILFYFGITVLFSLGLDEFMTEYKKKYKTIIGFFVLLLFVIAFLYFGLRFFYTYYSKYSFLNWLNYSSLALFLIPLGIFVYYKRLNFFGICSKSTLFTAYIAAYTLVFSFLFNSRDTNDSYNLREFGRQVENELNYNFVSELKRLTYTPGTLGYRAADDNFHNNFLPMHLVETIGFYTPFTPRGLCDAGRQVLGTGICYPSMPNFLRDCSSVNIFYSLSSIKYFVYKKADFDFCISGKGILNIVYSGPEFLIAQNPRVFERIRFLNSYVVIKDRNESLGLLKERNFEWHEKNFIVDADPALSKSGPSDQGISYRLIDSSPSLLKIEAGSNSDAMMVISNAYNSDWRVRVDGRKDRVYLVNGFFQGVKVQPGKHTYELSYFPLSLSLSMLLTFAMALLLFILKGANWRGFLNVS